MEQVIDRKFKIVAVNPCNHKYYTEKNAVLFCAKDEAFPAALDAYLEKCLELGCDSTHIDSIKLLIERVGEFQKTEKRIPDTTHPGERR